MPPPRAEKTRARAMVLVQNRVQTGPGLGQTCCGAGDVGRCVSAGMTGTPGFGR
jgi:hypothetical protein